MLLDTLLFSAMLWHFLHFLVNNNLWFLQTSCHPRCFWESIQLFIALFVILPELLSLLPFLHIIYRLLYFVPFTWLIRQASSAQIPGWLFILNWNTLFFRQFWCTEFNDANKWLCLQELIVILKQHEGHLKFETHYFQTTFMCWIQWCKKWFMSFWLHGYSVSLLFNDSKFYLWFLSNMDGIWNLKHIDSA